jgi:hypothetical protein
MMRRELGSRLMVSMASVIWSMPVPPQLRHW